MKKKIIKMFFDIKKEQDWLAAQKGWKLVKTNGMSYEFEECGCDYVYEYVYFEKSKKELDGIINGISDRNIELVCNSGSWALFRKNAAEGGIRVFEDDYGKYRMLMKKHDSYMALGACYMCLGASQTALLAAMNGLFWASSFLFYVCSFIFFGAASSLKKYASDYDDGTYAARLKKDK